jgi:nicotinate-nucleotide adenylyltransferase
MIGVLGGTFDPIHFGHLRPALELLQSVPLREIRFIPLKVAVHRPQPVADAVLREAMLQAAVAGQEGFFVDGRELHRSGPSYTYDTLRSLRQEMGAAMPISLLLGSDAFADFLSWHRPQGILEMAHLIVMQRPGQEIRGPERLRAWSAPKLCGGAAELTKGPGGRILVREVTQLTISATGIRDLVLRGLSPRYLLPDAVIEIIRREGLYRRSPNVPRKD